MTPTLSATPRSLARPPILRAQGQWPGAPNPQDWVAFKRRYLAADGRVIDTGNAGISHSEGQSYGMLFAVHFDDRAAFDLMWAWNTRVLRRPNDALSAWKYVPGARLAVPDTNNATDGDVILAWALLRAALRWGEPDYAERAAAIARDVLRLCVVSFVDRKILLPGLRGFNRGDRMVVNPSYFTIAAFRALSRLVSDPSWAMLETSSLEILRASAAGRWQLPPDWCEISTDGTLRPAPDWPPRFSWDAVRVPVHLGWVDVREGPVEAALNFFTDQAHPVKPPAWTDLHRDTIAPYAGHAGVQAVAQYVGLKTGRTARARRIALSEAPDYYGASLVLMTGLAAVEAPEAPAFIPPAPREAPRPGRLGSVMRYFGIGGGAEPAPTSHASPNASPLARRGGRDGGR